MRKTICCLLGLALLLCGCGGRAFTGTAQPAATADPHAGMVEADDGRGGTMWVKNYDTVPVNALTAADFSGGTYIGSEITVLRGIDVSEHQGAVDWAAAAGDSISFALIRAGYRGYGMAGNLREDERFRDNLSGALENGLDVGVYFFSQAVLPEEAREEAAFLLELLEPFGPDALKLPVFFDWEYIEGETARTDEVTGSTLTECALAFCEVLSGAGYEPGIYAYRYLGYNCYDLSRITAYPLWIGAVNDYPDFRYAHSFWQYSTEGSVAGIEGEVDLDLRFLAGYEPE